LDSLLSNMELNPSVSTSSLPAESRAAKDDFFDNQGMKRADIPHPSVFFGSGIDIDKLSIPTRDYDPKKLCRVQFFDLISSGFIQVNMPTVRPPISIESYESKTESEKKEALADLEKEDGEWEKVYDLCILKTRELHQFVNIADVFFKKKRASLFQTVEDFRKEEEDEEKDPKNPVKQLQIILEKDKNLKLFRL